MSVSVFTKQPAPHGVNSKRDRINHIQKVLDDSNGLDRLTSIKAIEERASVLHQCRCGGDLAQLSAKDVDLTKLLAVVDERVAECWDKYAEMQGEWEDQSQVHAAEVSAEDKACITEILNENKACHEDPCREVSTAAPAARSTDQSGSVRFRGLPNIGNTCFMNTPITALAFTSGVLEAIGERLDVLENDPTIGPQLQKFAPLSPASGNSNKSQLECHTGFLRGLRQCIQYIKNESVPDENVEIESVLADIRSNYLGVVPEGNQIGGQNDANTSFLWTVLADFLPNFCPEGSIVHRSLSLSVPGTELDVDELDVDELNENGLIRIPLDQPVEQTRVELSTLLETHFSPYSVPDNHGRVHQRSLGDTAPDNLVILLDRARQVALGDRDSGPQGFAPERQLRSDIRVGLPSSGIVEFQGQRYRVEASGLHHSSGRRNANLNSSGGHYTSFIPDLGGASVGVGTHFSDSVVTDRRGSNPYDHSSLEAGVAFVMLRKIKADPSSEGSPSPTKLVSPITTPQSRPPLPKSQLFRRQ